MPRNTAFFMHQRAVQIVQQQRTAAGAGSVDFIAPSFNNNGVYWAEPDGSGGFYFGGSFTSVTCNVTSTTYTTGYERFIHCKPTGEVNAAFSCPVSETVENIRVGASGVYVCAVANLMTVGGVLRGGLARVRPASDALPGAVDAWYPGATMVQSMYLDEASSQLFISHNALTIGGTGTDNDPAVNRRTFAAIGTGSAGTVQAWNPSSTGGGTIGRFGWSRLAGGDFVLGGSLQDVGSTGADIDPSVSRLRLARISSATPSSASAWRPDANDTVLGLAVDEADNAAYPCGLFAQLGSASGDFSAVTRNRVGKVSLSVPSSAIAWRPDANGNVISVTVSGSDVILFGAFTQVGGAGADFTGTARNRIAMVSSAAPATLNSWDPNAGGSVFGGLLLGGGKLLVWGFFTTMANHVLSGGVRCAVLELPA